MNPINTEVSMNKVTHQREAILRFYAAMTNTSYDDVVDEYLGKSIKGGTVSNRLYQATEMAINYMNEAEQL